MSGVRTVNSGLRCRHDHFTNCVAASCHDVLVIMRYPILKSLLIPYSDFIHQPLLLYPASQSFHSPQKSIGNSQARLKFAWPITTLLKSSNMACYILHPCWLILLAASLMLTQRTLNSPAPTSPNLSNPPSIPHTAAAAYSTHQT